MNITYKNAKTEDIDRIFQLCKALIDQYENTDQIEYDKVLRWVRKKLENSISEYTAVYADGQKVGYYHFFQNDDGEFELDDLYVFPEFQNRGIGTIVIQKCCREVSQTVMLYVFIRNCRAVSLYKKLGFEIVERIKDRRYIMKRRCHEIKEEKNASVI